MLVLQQTLGQEGLGTRLAMEYVYCNFKGQQLKISMVKSHTADQSFYLWLRL